MASFLSAASDVLFKDKRPDLEILSQAVRNSGDLSRLRRANEAIASLVRGLEQHLEQCEIEYQNE